jgi:bacterioferritin
MEAKEGVVERLNGALTIELTAINQYFLAAKQCGHWGFARLERVFRALSLDEMKDTDGLIERILFLDGLPNMQRLNPVAVGESVPEVLQAGLDLELGAVEFLREAIAHCVRVGDFTTRAMFEEMIQDEERHVDWFETQMETIRTVGLERYLSQHISVEVP